MRAVWLVWSLLCAWRAAAQTVTFSDGFESGTLLGSEVPPGQWTSKVVQTTQNSLDASTLAARSGAYGLRFVDGRSTGGQGDENHLSRTLDPSTGDFEFRLWMRVASSNDAGEIVAAMIHGPGGVNRSLLEIVVAWPGAQLQLQGYDRFGANGSQKLDASWPVGWHEVALVVRNVGTTAGVREIWLDGVRLVQQTGIDWVGKQVDEVLLGEPWADRVWLGELHFDDVRAGTTITIGTDAGGDAGPDAGPDGGPMDGGSDAGGDGGSIDAGGIDGGEADAGGERPDGGKPGPVDDGGSPVPGDDGGLVRADVGTSPASDLRVGCDCGAAGFFAIFLGAALARIRRRE